MVAAVLGVSRAVANLVGRRDVVGVVSACHRAAFSGCRRGRWSRNNLASYTIVGGIARGTVDAIVVGMGIRVGKVAEIIGLVLAVSASFTSVGIDLLDVTLRAPTSIFADKFFVGAASSVVPFAVGIHFHAVFLAVIVAVGLTEGPVLMRAVRVTIDPYPATIWIAPSLR